MAEEQLPGNPQSPQPTTEEPMDLETETNGAKRAREEDCEAAVKGDELSEEGNGDSKKPKAAGDSSFEEQRLEETKSSGDGEKESGDVTLGPKVFGSAVEMFDYFLKLLHAWPSDLVINKYEHMVLLDLLKKGHADPEKKVGAGIKAFLVREHPMWKSQCFFVERADGSFDDFSFRKCIDNILPLPENLKGRGAEAKSRFSNKQGYDGGRGGRGGGGRGGRGRGRKGGYRK